MIWINGTKIGKGFKPYVIAELSANHGGSILRAKSSIAAAKRAGADAVKMQTYTPDTMTIDCNLPDFQITEGLWQGHNLYQLYRTAFTPYEWHQELFSYAKSIDITIFSTPFDESAVDLLENLKSPAYKIASFELTDISLIEYAAKRKKPMLMSTGMADLREIGDALEACKLQDNHEILLFHCISNYPTKLEEANLNRINLLAREFNVEVGLSDHSLTSTAATAAIALGASAIEKHFKVDNEECGPDSSFSILPTELKELVTTCNGVWQALEDRDSLGQDSQKSSRGFRRSLYFVKDLEPGDTISADNTRRIRPGYGLAPKHYADVLGKEVARHVKRGEPVTWESLQG